MKSQSCRNCKLVRSFRSLFLYLFHHLHWIAFPGRRSEMSLSVALQSALSESNPRSGHDACVLAIHVSLVDKGYQPSRVKEIDPVSVRMQPSFLSNMSLSTRHTHTSMMIHFPRFLEINDVSIWCAADLCSFNFDHVIQDFFLNCGVFFT